MNRRQHVFLRELSRTASILADHIDNVPEEKEESAFGYALWRSMYYLGRDVRHELEGLLKGSAADDCFEVSCWFEYMRTSYGRYSQVLTFCQILCGAFGAGCTGDAAGALRLFARAVSLGTMSGSSPDMIPVWQFLIKHRDAFFGSFGSMLAQLCCCAGEDKKYREHLKMIFCFIRAFASGPEEKERILAAVHSGTVGKDPRLFIALEAAYV